ncbi:MAG: hypothetical protein MRY74_17055 [Neomegalonema sp.]|nr:hypothetical protein [Neomegalonema sp.]
MTKLKPVRVYISAARGEEKLVAHLAERLSAAGFSPFFEPAPTPDAEAHSKPSPAAGKTPLIAPQKPSVVETAAQEIADTARRKRLTDEIAQADFIVAIIGSTRYWPSERAWEINEAIAHAKPILSAIAAIDDPAAPPLALRSHPALALKAEQSEAAAQIIEALQHLRSWTDERSRLTALAEDWRGARRPRRKLLKGLALRRAEAWRSTPAGSAPQATALHHAFIDASRRSMLGRQNSRIAVFASLTIIGIALALLAALQQVDTVRAARSVGAALRDAIAAHDAAEKKAADARDALARAERRREQAELRSSAAEARRAAAEARRAAAEARERRVVFTSSRTESEKRAAEKSAADARAEAAKAARAYAAAEASRKVAEKKARTLKAASSAASEPARKRAERYHALNLATAEQLIHQLAPKLASDPTASPDAAKRVLRQADRVLVALFETSEKSPRLMRAKAALLAAQGEIALREGDADAAAKAFATSAEFTLLQPTSSEQAYELSRIFEKLGAAQHRAAEKDAARAAFEAAAASARQGVKAEPKKNKHQRRLISALFALGDWSLSEGGTEGARAAYREALAISATLAAAEPAPARMADLHSAAMLRIGDLAKAEGDRAKALTHYEESLALRRRIAAPGGPTAGAARMRIVEALARIHETTVVTLRRRETLVEMLSIQLDLQALGLLPPKRALQIPELRAKLRAL